MISGSGGCRKVRQSIAGKGKRGGVIVALTIYGKGTTENISAHILQFLAKELGHGAE